jgi:hypothetical protein
MSDAKAACPAHSTPHLSIVNRCRDWLRRHPLVRSALLWALPAIILGGVLRVMLLSYSPFAYWGSDSNSYFSFSELLLNHGKTSLYDKRRYVYPILLLPITLLPGGTLRWVAWFQHGLGLATLVPLAYCVRKAFVSWRWTTIPVTLLYAGLPIILWYEHELLAENVFFAGIVWTCAGWMAWQNESRPERKQRLWWWFFVPFAVVVLTKASGRFLWPGAFVALVCVAAWRSLRWRDVGALASILALTFTIGQDSQGSWLLYTSAFPLTRMDTSLHAEYKAEISDLVADAQKRVEEFRTDENRSWKRFLKNPEEQSQRPLWTALGNDPKKKMTVYRDLAVEGISAHPFQFLSIAGQKIMSSANPNDFKAERFATDYYPRRFEHLFERYTTESPWRLRTLFGLPRHQPLPSFATLRQKIEPHPDAPASKWIGAYDEAFERVFPLAYDASDEPGKPPEPDRVAPLGWWLVAGALLSFLPTYFRNLGIWTIIIAGYLLGVFLVGGANARFFGAAWGVLALLMAVPLDIVVRLLRRAFPRSARPAS